MTTQALIICNCGHDGYLKNNKYSKLQVIEIRIVGIFILNSYLLVYEISKKKNNT